jgi:hypothetical protein
MSTITDVAEAAARVADAIAADQEPVLTATTGGQTESEVEKILAQCVIARQWTAATSYALGDLVIPTAENGLAYRLTEYTGLGSTLSGGAEPSWVQSKWSRLLDGALIWECEGPAPYALWDLQLAVHLGWKRKAALVADRYDQALDGKDDLKRSQMVDRFEKMAKAALPGRRAVTLARG